MNVVFFVRKVGEDYFVLRIKKKEDELWSYFEGSQQDIGKHIPLLLEKVKFLKMSKRGRRVPLTLDRHIIKIYYDQNNDQFKFINRILPKGKISFLY